MLGIKNQQSLNKLLGILYYLDLKGRASRADIGNLIRWMEPERADAPVAAMSLLVSRQIAILRESFRMDISVNPHDGFMIRRWGIVNKDTFREEIAPLFPEMKERVEKEIREYVLRKAELEKAKAEEKAEKERLKAKAALDRKVEKAMARGAKKAAEPSKEA